MSRRVVTIETNPSRHRMVLRGYRAAELARDAGLKPIWAGSARGWILDLHRLTDLAAYLDYRGVEYFVTEAGDAA